MIKNPQINNSCDLWNALFIKALISIFSDAACSSLTLMVDSIAPKQLLLNDLCISFIGFNYQMNKIYKNT